MNLTRNHFLLPVILIATALVIGPASTQASPAGPCLPGAVYDPACDVNHDGAINVLDIQLAAGHWGHAGPWSSSSWDLTGNAGTTPGTNFLGTIDNQPLELKVNNQRALRLEPHATSPNVVGGHSSNAVTPGAYGATIAGGGSAAGPNTVGGTHGVVGGGYANGAGGPYATVGGGIYNQVTAQYGTIAGGGYAINGQGNRVTDEGGFVGGGGNNQAGNAAGPTTDAYYATVSGGWANIAAGKYATVPGGEGNTAFGDFGFAAGHGAHAANQGCFVWGDSTNDDVICSTPDLWIARASGGVDFFTNAGLTSGVYLTAGGSSWNVVSSRAAKENLAPVDGRALLERLAAIEIGTWNYTAQDPAIRHVGPMADDFNALLAGLGGEGQESINSLDADGVALAAIQALYRITQKHAAQNAALRQELTVLSQQNADLALRLAALEESLSQ